MFRNNIYKNIIICVIFVFSIIIFADNISYAFYKKVEKKDVIKSKISGFNEPIIINATSTNDSIYVSYKYEKNVSDVSEKIYYGTNKDSLTEYTDTNIIKNLKSNTKYYLKKCFINQIGGEACSEVSSILTAGKVDNFLYNGTDGTDGSVQTYQTICNGTFKLETWGAQGGSSSESAIGGYGAYSKGIINIEKSEKIYINVGGKGESNTNKTLKNDALGGYNGGGTANSNDTSGASSGGGGATHIAKVSGLLSTLENVQNSILIVSAGGGGAIDYYFTSDWNFKSSGGSGGGIVGGLASGFPKLVDATSATQTSGGCITYSGIDETCGLFGKSNYVNSGNFPGGGGGYYGGIGGAATAGTGGSSYIGNSLLLDKAMYCYGCEESSEESTKTVSTFNVSEEPISNYAKIGNGHARITIESCSISSDSLIPKVKSATSNNNSITVNYDLDSTNTNLTSKIYYGTTESNLSLSTDSNVISNLDSNKTYYFKECLTNENGEEFCSKVSSLLTAGKVENFSYNGTTGSDGSAQIYQTACNGIFKLEVWGAQGGSYDLTYHGGYGAYSYGKKAIASDEKMYLFVGGAGNFSTYPTYAQGGYNGGGRPNVWWSSDTNGYMGEGAGGGATHISFYNNILSNSFAEQKKILIVSSGGGGAIYTNSSKFNQTSNSSGGSGGGYLGTKGNGIINYTKNYEETIATLEYGGYLTYNGKNSGVGSFGLGGSYMVGGGGGFYGGNGGADYGGGGGTSFISDLSNAATYCYECVETNDISTKTISTIGSNSLTDKTNCPNGYSEIPISKCAKKGNGYARITIESCSL